MFKGTMTRAARQLSIGFVLVMAIGMAAPEAFGASAQLNFVQQPSNTVAGRAISAAPTVRALDTNGNPVSNVSVTVSYTGTGLTGTLTQITNGSGIATFSDLKTTTRTAQNNKRLEATATNYNQGNSSNFDFTANVAPVLTAIGNKNVNENVNLSFTVSATDATPSTTLTYSASNLPSGATFNTSTRVFSWTPSFTQAGSYPNVTFSVSDEIGAVSEAITITVNNVNSAPTVNAAGPFSIAENSANGTNVGTPITASDPDAGETATLSFSIFSGNTGSAFAISSSSGQITVNSSAALNYEATQSYSLTIRATDVNGATDDEVVTVNVTNVNEAPTVNAAGPFSLAENSAAATAVGTVTASDPDSGQTATLVFSITGGNTGNAFAINSGTGAITVNTSSALDYETTPTFTLTIRATDANTAWDEESVTINLTNVNEGPTVNAVGPFAIAENSADETAVGTVTASDPDAGDTLTFSITAGNTGDAFAIDGTTGLITVDTNAALDYETNPTFTLTIRATDVDSAWDEGDVTVNLTNVNEDPTVNAAGPFTVAENSANGMSVGTVTASDPDADQTATLTFSIEGGNTGSAFAIGGSSGAITVNDSTALDYETNPTFTLTVRATDAGGAWDEESVTVDLTNVNEGPTVNPAGPFAVDENSANGTTVGTVTASDPEDAPPSLSSTGKSGSSSIHVAVGLTFSITAGNAAGVFAIDSSTGVITVADNSGLDFETNPTFTLTIRATDTGSLWDEENVTINVSDVNETPTVNAVGPFSLAENSANTTAVGTVTASDPDGDDVTFAIMNGNTGFAFAIGGSSGAITVNDSSALDYETNPTFTLTIRGTDESGAWDEGDVTINLTNVNEDPTVNSAGPFTVAENSANGTSVGTVTASDPDAGQTATLTFSIEGGNTGSAFAIGSSSGVITVNDTAALDYETNPTFTLTIRATDASSAWDGENVTINVSNVNEGPTVNAVGPFSLAENSANTTAVGTVTASDPDDGDDVTFAIMDGNTGFAFAIGGSSGAITVNDSSALDYETNPTFTLTIRGTDESGAWDEENVTVNLTNVNEDPTVNAAGPFTVAENSANGTSVGTVTASDPDAGQTATLTFSIEGGNTGSAFAIGGSSGAITVNDSTALDYETNPTFTLTVRATDAGGLWDEESVTVNLTGANDPPTVNAAGPFSLAENSANGTSVGSVTASDPDSGQTATLTFSIEGGNTGGAFAIDGSTGAITVNSASALDFETTPVFTLTVRATDVNAAWDEESVTVGLTDQNEAPTANNATFSVFETASNGAPVGTVSATDPDDGDGLTYVITAGNESGTFGINPNTGQITVANSANLDSVGTPSYELTVTVTDEGELSDTATITINVTATPDAASRSVTFSIYNQGRGGSLPSHVRAVLSDYPPNAAHDLGDGKDVELEVALLSGGCAEPACTPMLQSGDSSQYATNFEVPVGGFGRHTVGSDNSNNAVDNADGTFSLTAAGSSSSWVTFLFGRYLLIQADADDEAAQSLGALKSNDRQGVLVPGDAPAFGELTHLSATFQSTAGGDGTPHIDVYLQGHGKLRIRLGSSPAFNDTDATMNTYSSFNVIGNDDAGRYDTSGLTDVVGTTSSSATWTEAVTLAGEFVISRIEFVADDDGTTGSRQYELQSINVAGGGGGE